MGDSPFLGLTGREFLLVNPTHHYFPPWGKSWELFVPVASISNEPNGALLNGTGHHGVASRKSQKGRKANYGRYEFQGWAAGRRK